MPSSHEPCLKVLSLTLEEELYLKVIFIDEWGLREAKLPQSFGLVFFLSLLSYLEDSSETTLEIWGPKIMFKSLINSWNYCDDKGLEEASLLGDELSSSSSCQMTKV